MLAAINSKQGISYDEYIQLIDRLIAEGKTTGANQSESYLEYTRINQQRRKRLDKTTIIEAELTNHLQRIDRKWQWMVITEAWCGDAAQNVPVIAKMASVSDNISLKLYLRDENPELMDAYLTNGSRSIPKLICFDSKSMRELGVWGPRPLPAQQMVMRYKKDPQVPYKEFVKDVQLWYAKDKTQSIQEEFKELVLNWLTIK